MNKEPIGLYLFRYIVGIGILFFLAMLYWSSVHLEEEIQDVERDMAEIKNELFILQGEVNKAPTPSAQAAHTAPIAGSRREDLSLPNILEEDPFYTTTLPKLLGAAFKPHGTYREAAIGKPDNLHPFSNWQNVATWQEQCTAAAARQQFGKYETFAPDLAVRMELRHRPADQAVEYWVFLRDNVYWQPLTPEMFAGQVTLAPQFLRKHKVTAHDFKFYFDAVKNPFVEDGGAVAMRTYLNDLEEVEVIDDLTFVARWKTRKIAEADGTYSYKAKYISKQMTGGLRPMASFVYKYFPNGEKIVVDDSDPSTYRKNSVWAQNFEQHWAQNVIVSCGPWVFTGMNDREIRFRRNPDFYNPLAVLFDESVILFRETPDAVWQDFEADKLDTYTLQPDQTIELANFLASSQYKRQSEAGDAIKRLEYIARSYAYVGWNQAKPYFKSRKVRQAMTMAIDRQRIVQQYLNELGVTINGPFYPYSPDYDSSIPDWPFDLDTARRLLQEEGWYDKNNDGVIEKNIDGKEVSFQFTLTYYVKNPTTKAIADYISTALKELGIVCSLNGVDIADLSAVFDGKSFDAILLGWSLGTPPEEVRQLWSSAGASEKGSSNAIGFSNAEVDKIIDKLDYAYGKEERIKLYHRFDEIIHDECPYTFLYAPKAVMLYRDYLQNVWIPADRQDLVPGANVAEPDPSIFWIKKHA